MTLSMAINEMYPEPTIEEINEKSEYCSAQVGTELCGNKIKSGEHCPKHNKMFAE